MVYIGSSFVPQERFYHLVSGQCSNDNLQQTITKYGLAKLTVLVFILFDVEMIYVQRKLHLLLESSYIAKYSKYQLYNKNAKV
jgi:hypothetical protein